MANLTVKAEYLYARFEGETVSGSFTGGDGFTSLSANLLAMISDINLHVFRLGLNYRFGDVTTAYDRSEETAIAIEEGPGIPGPFDALAADDQTRETLAERPPNHRVHSCCFLPVFTVL